jgi:NitT/TauT family transport system permease protein
VKRFSLWLLYLLLPGAVGLATFLLLWQGIVWWWNLPPYLLPGPGRVLATAIEQGEVLRTAIRLTASAALCGLLGSLVVGILLAVIFSQSVFLERCFYPYAIFLQTVPVVAISPILILLSGHGFRTIVLISSIIGLFPILASGTAGLRAVHPSLLDLFRLHRATTWQILWKLRLPTAVPYFLTGVRTASGLAVLGAIVGESFTDFGDAGLGYLTAVTFRQQKTAFLYAVALTSSALGIAFFALVGLVERVFLRKWSQHPG